MTTPSDAPTSWGDGPNPPPPRRPGVPLKDRRASTGHQPVAASALPAPTVRHVWVRNPSHPATGPPQWVAGLLLRWEHGPEGLCGQVSYIVDEAGSPVLVTQVLPRALIRPAT